MRWRRALLAAAAACAALFAAAVPPTVAFAYFLPAAAGIQRAWWYLCSMVLGAAPYLAGGALIAAAALPFAGRAASPRSVLLISFAGLFCGCDCSMNALAPSLARMPPRIAACVLMWGSCCSLPALFFTLAILGSKMLEARVAAGLVAAGLTAALWPGENTLERCADACKQDFPSDFVRCAGAGLGSFVPAACVAALCLVFAPSTRMQLAAAPFAAFAGALLSPCSTADALLASVFFRAPSAQIAFIVSAQCLDVRALSLLVRTFGAGRALRAAAAATIACAAGCLIAAR